MLNPPCLQEVLMDFPQLTMTLPDGREESIMKRTTLVRARQSGWHCFGSNLATHR